MKTRNEGVRTRRARKLEQLQNEEKVFIEQEDENDRTHIKKRTKKLKIKKLPLHTLQQLEGDNIKKKLSTNQIKLLLLLLFVVLFILQGALINFFR